jgi:hypothetical protein
MAEDYEAAMATGVVVKKVRSVRDSKDSYLVVDEYEINSALIECLNSVEKRAAIETGQEVDRQDIKLRAGQTDQAEVLKRTFTFEELDQMQRRMQATVDAERSGKVVEAKAEPVQKDETTPALRGAWGELKAPRVRKAGGIERAQQVTLSPVRRVSGSSEAAVHQRRQADRRDGVQALPGEHQGSSRSLRGPAV